MAKTDEQRNQPAGCLGFLLGLSGVAPETSNDAVPEQQEAEEQPTAGPADAYVLVEQLLTPTELEYYAVLRPVLSKYAIFAKVRLADVFLAKPGPGNRAAFNRVKAKHLDFLVCDPSSMKPLLAIELDDATHARKDRAERDAFLDQVCNAAGLRLLRVKAASSYEPATVREQLKAAFSDRH